MSFTVNVNDCTIGAILDGILAGFLTVIVGLLFFSLGIECTPEGRPAFHLWVLVLFSLLVTVFMTLVLLYVPVLNMQNC